MMGDNERPPRVIDVDFCRVEDLESTRCSCAVVIFVHGCVVR